MIKYENECVGCTEMGLYCLGTFCPNLNIPHLFCDKCRHEVEELRNYHGDELCPDCILENYDPIEP